MANITLAPLVRCDNCGATVDQVKAQGEQRFVRPSGWGSINAIGARSTDTYGGRDKIAFTDLCPKCAQAALDAAAGALKKIREASDA